MISISPGWENYIVGGIVALGAVAYNVWGYIQAKGESKVAVPYEPWRLVKTVVPGLVLGFMAGYGMSVGSTVDVVSLLAAGFGVAAAQSRTGITYLK